MASTDDVLDTTDAGPAALRGSALRITGYLAGVGLSLASAPLLVRHLGVVGFGEYVTVLSIVLLAAGATEAGLNAIALREHATLRGEAREKAMRDVLGIRIVLSVASIVVAIAFMVVAGYRSALVLGALVAGVGVMLTALQMLVGTPLQSELRLGAVTAAELVRQVATVALLVALVVAGAGVVPFLAVALPAGLVGLVVTIALVGGRMPLRPSFDPRGWWPLMRETLPFTAATALGAVYFRLILVVMGLVTTELETGYFATSFRVVEVLLVVPALVVGAAYPILARAERDDDARFRYAMGRILELGLMLGVWLALSLSLAAPAIMEVLGGEAAAPSAGVLRIQSLAFIGTALSVAAGFGLLTLRRYRPLLVANAAALACAVVFVLVLTPDGGARGAALAAVIAEGVLGAITVAALLRARPDLVRPAAPALLVVAAGALALAVELVPGVPALAAFLLGNVVFFGTLLALGRFPPEVRDALRARGAAP